LYARLATDAARCSARCVTRGAESPECGVRRLAGETVNGQRFIEADGHGSTQRTQTGSRFIVTACALRNPLAALRKQRTCRGKNSLSRTTPLPGLKGRFQREGSATGFPAIAALPRSLPEVRASSIPFKPKIKPKIPAFLAGAARLQCDCAPYIPRLWIMAARRTMPLSDQFKREAASGALKESLPPAS